MAEVTGKTSESLDALFGTTIATVALGEDGTLTFTRKNGSVVNAGTVGNDIVSASINSSGHLIFKSRSGAITDAGPVLSSVKPLDSWPVGSVYMGVTPANPTSLLGGGTWVQFAAGRVVVGVSAGESEFDAVEELGGSKTVTLDAENLPPHAHTIAHTHTPFDPDFNFLVNKAGATKDRGSGNDFQASVSGRTSGPSTPNSGDGPGISKPVPNLQPYITAYLWKRTA